MLEIKQPTLLIDKTICVANIKRILEKANSQNCTFRPHFKTHQSAEIGNWFKALGIDKCTVSSMQMAQYFANAGWKDITVAFPFNILETDILNEIARNTNVNICIESVEVGEYLNVHVNSTIGLFIKIDAGYHRTGVDAGDNNYINQIIQTFANNKKIAFQGFLQHAGHTYHVQGKSEVRKIHDATISSLKRLKKQFVGKYPDLILSTGDTPSCSICDDFSDIDELRPGNLAFYDVMQANIGACNYSDIAVAMACPVVAKHTDRNEIIIYGGAVHFSKDFILNIDGQKVFGLVSRDSKDWAKVDPDAYIKKLSQEHGTIHANDELLKKIKVGDILYCLPVHSCLTANLMNGYLSTSGEYISMFRYQATN
jgi:D-serine deaminase-like pyridoxal phosphate-dependent protein